MIFACQLTASEASSLVKSMETLFIIIYCPSCTVRMYKIPANWFLLNKNCYTSAAK